jgi:hypothetical protein
MGLENLASQFSRSGESGLAAGALSLPAGMATGHYTKKPGRSRAESAC